jgi:hypothetical protein
MPYNQPARTLIATKMASTTVQLAWYDAQGGLVYIGIVPAADFTSFNTTVNGGAAGATLTRTYAEDLNQGDYPQGYTPEN